METARRRQGQGDGKRPHRAGVVALLGLPNAGKSTLLNRLLGEKLAIVTPKAQTTRSRILGILSLPHAQLLLHDTPGLHEGARPLDRAMQQAVEEAAKDCDLALLLVDPERGWQAVHDAWLARLRQAGKPVVVVGTKLDRSAQAPWPPEAARDATRRLRVSSRSGEGIAELLEALVALSPEGPAYYPEDQLTDRPWRFLAAEAVREAAFRVLAEEVPYALAVEVVEFDESREGPVRIRANLLVQRESQKAIVIGAGGARVKQIGVRARRELERMLDRHVYLELRAKRDPDWARRPKRLKSLGYY